MNYLKTQFLYNVQYAASAVDLFWFTLFLSSEDRLWKLFL